ncbi:MAG: hypothetical protein E7660_03735 [Ruminococcaceae bacterium]|nr:hypothetical protein [Oscillospiraceae bacterium]
MKKICFAVTSFVLAAIMCLSLCSCSRLSDEDAVNTAASLLEKSCEINEIFYGKGIDVDEKSNEYALEALNEDVDIKVASYADVHADYPYQTVEELKNAALSVYSSDYCESMFDIAFTGHKDSKTGAIVEYARFIESEYGILTQRVDIEDEILYNGRTFDVDSIKIVKKTASYVVFTVDSKIDGEPSDTIKVKMLKEEDGTWKLDTPTY